MAVALRKYAGRPVAARSLRCPAALFAAFGVYPLALHGASTAQGTCDVRSWYRRVST